MPDVASLPWERFRPMAESRVEKTRGNGYSRRWISNRLRADQSEAGRAPFGATIPEVAGGGTEELIFLVLDSLHRLRLASPAPGRQSIEPSGRRGAPGGGARGRQEDGPMADGAKSDGQPVAAEGCDREVTARVLRTLSLVVANTLRGRWLSRSDQHDAVRHACEALDAWFVATSVDELYLRLLGGELNAAGMLFNASDPDVEPLAGQLDALGVPALAILKGMTDDEYGHLLEILGARPAELDLLGGFQAFAAKIGVTHAVARNIVLREVAEDDVVVKKGRAAAAVPAAGEERAGLVAFLKDGEGGGDTARETLSRIQDDAEGVGGLILDAAREAADMGQAIGEAVRRAFDCWTKSPAARTQKGKKELARFVGRLQDWLKLNAPEGVQASTAVAETFDDIGDELKMDTLATEYLRKRKAISDSEARILRYIRRKGREGIEESELERRLVEGGLEGSDWRDLLVRSGVAGTGGSEEAVRFLSQRLFLLESVLREQGPQTAEDPAKLASDLKRIAVDVDAMVIDTNRKVQDIIDEYRQEDAAIEAGAVDAAGVPLRKSMPRRALYEKLSEIGQELCQPLSVINCSISMITSGRLGVVTGGQVDMLNLAVESAQKLKQIVDSLMEMTGMPKGLEPDAKIQAELYQ